MSKARRILIVEILIGLSLVGLVIPLHLAGATVTCSASQSPAWQNCGPIQTGFGINFQPATVQAANGSIWLAWTAEHDQNGIPTTGHFNVLYAVRMPNGTWMHPGIITTQSGQNQNPAIAQLSNGTIYIFWNYKSTSSQHYQIYSRRFSGSTWSPYSLITNTPAGRNDTLPSAAVGKDGTLWLAWTRDNSTASGSGQVMRQLWYKTLKAGVWSSETNITSTSDVNWNWQPSITVPKDGVARLVFARGQSSPGNFQINYVTNSGVGWSAPTPITSQCTTACSGDANPSLIQDRNGTLWLFWSRNVVVSATTDYVVYSKYSRDGGSTWTSPETPLTATSSTGVESQTPAAVQSNTSLDENIWVFYATNISGSETDLWGLKTLNPVYPVHDVTVSILFPTNPLQYPGGLASIGESAVEALQVQVNDVGDFNENASVTLTATNSTSYTFGPVTARMKPGNSTILTYNWTTVFDVTKPGLYNLSAVATIPVETLGNTADGSTILKHSVHILPPGDVDQDGSVTANDVSEVKLAYGSQPCSLYPNNPICYLYNPYFDYSNTKIIDANDVSIAIAHYGIFT